MAGLWSSGGAAANAAVQSSLNDELHDAAAIGDVAALRAALAAGADIEARKTKFGASRTPLCSAVEPDDEVEVSADNRTACVRALLSAGAVASAPITMHMGHGYYTALHDAVYLGLYTVCRLLLDAGADVNARNVSMGSDDDYRTPLYYAANRQCYTGRHQKVIALLLSRGAVDGPDVFPLPYLKKIRPSPFRSMSDSIAPCSSRVTRRSSLICCPPSSSPSSSRSGSTSDSISGSL